MTDTAPLTVQQLADIRRRGRSTGLVTADEAFRDYTALLAEVDRLRASLDEMTRCRDNALRALCRDDVATDIDLEETIAEPFYGPGWDWDQAALDSTVREAAAAVRPAFGKLTQQRDEARAERDRLLAFIERGFDTHMRFNLAHPDGTTEELPCADWCHACKFQRTEAERDQARAELGKYVGHEPTLREEMAEVGRRLDAVDQIHQPTDHGGLQICQGCSRKGHIAIPWPCATANALNGDTTAASAPTT